MSTPLSISFETKQQGFGCMGFSVFNENGISGEEQAIDVMRYALDHGVKIFNSASFYGPLNEQGFGHNVRLIGKLLQQIDRSKIFLTVKIGMDTRCPLEKTGTVWNMKGDYESLNKDVNYCLEQLHTDYIDTIILCRVDANTPIEESVLAMKRIVDSGKARYIGLSEASATTIRRAYAVTPIQFIEQEYSLWSRDIEVDILPTCRELGIKILAYSPLGRGFLTGTLKNRADMSPKDFRLHSQPRFSEENFDKNYALVEAATVIATRKGLSLGEIALAWVHAQGNDIIPIPGTTKIANLEKNLNALNLVLTEAELKELGEIFDPKKVLGDRYANMAMTFHGNKHT